MSETKPKGNFIKKSTIILIIFSVVFFMIYVLSDRHVPNTDQATVKGLVLPIAPMVNGYITKVNVGLHSNVKKGDTLFEIENDPYMINTNIAESNLNLVEQNIEAGKSGVKMAEAALSRSRIMLDKATKTWERVQKVSKIHEGALSESDKEAAEAAYLRAIEQVESSEANLDKIIKTLGPTDNTNPNIQVISNQIKQAKWNLKNTFITAPTDGIIESFNVEVGHFASAGHPLISLVTLNEKVWVQANLKENNLSNISIGNEVDITFDIEPGKIFKGKVESVSNGVNTGNENPGSLPKVSSQQGWLKDPQRFPVIITIEDSQIKSKLRQGSQAEIVVYTGDRPILNSIAKLRIWLISKLSYVR